MLKQTHIDFGARFLLKFTRELIKNTKTYSVFEIEKESIIEEKQVKDSEKKGKQEVKGLVKEKLAEDSKKISEMEKKGLQSELKKVLEPPKQLKNPAKKRLRWNLPAPIPMIQESELPETVRYLKPVPTSEEIDLGKLNILVRDPLIKIIECNEPGKNIIVTGMMGKKKTPVILNKEEMEDVLQRFSQAAKIPVHEGLFKAAVGRLVISAVISEIVGIQFVIRKISPEVQYM